MNSAECSTTPKLRSVIVQSTDMRMFRRSTPRQCSWYMLERDVHRTYTHESALTRRMWYSTVTPTDPDMRRVSWGQSAQTTTSEVSFALYIYIVQSADMHVSAFYASSVQLGT